MRNMRQYFKLEAVHIEAQEWPGHERERYLLKA